MSKVLSAVNYSHKRYGLKRFNFNKVGQHSAFKAVISNFRKYIHNLGYDCSLLDDSEIMGFEEDINVAELDGDTTLLIEILEFLSK